MALQMLFKLHKKAFRTVAIWEYVRGRGKRVKALARKLSLNVATVCKRRGRASAREPRAGRTNLQATLSLAQEALLVKLRNSVEFGCAFSGTGILIDQLAARSSRIGN